MDFETIEYRKRHNSVWITLNQPDSLNALSLAMSTELEQALTALSNDGDARVLVLTANGRGFCAGGDVAAFNDDPDNVGPILSHVHAVMRRLAALDMPIVAGINGITVGAGMGLCMAVDLAIAAESSAFTMAYTAIGATPDGSSTFFLPRMVGTRRAMELAVTNRKLNAQDALDWGLVNQVVPDDELGDALDRFVAKLEHGPTRAYAGVRHLLHASLQSTRDEQLDREGDSIVAMSQTADFREGVAAFMQKRKAEFHGR